MLGESHLVQVLSSLIPFKCFATWFLAACDVCEQEVGSGGGMLLCTMDLSTWKGREPSDGGVRTKAGPREAADPEGSQPSQGEKCIPVGKVKNSVLCTSEYPGLMWHQENAHTQS